MSVESIKIKKVTNKPLLTITDFIAGTLAGIGQVLSGQPFDIVKVKLQTMTNNILSTSQIVKQIYTAEGIKGFYKGTASPLVGVSFSVSVQFGSNELAKRWLKKSSPDKFPLHYYIYCGAFSGFCAAFVNTPVELFRIIMQTQPSEGPKKYESTGDCIKNIYSEHGIIGMYKGLYVTIVRELLAYMPYFGIYESFMHVATERHGSRAKIPLHEIASYGMISGIFFWLAMYPIDVVKSHIQTDEIEMSKRKYKSSMDCARQLYAKGGINAFSKGLGPCLIRAVIANAVTFLTFEKVSGILNNRSNL